MKEELELLIILILIFGLIHLTANILEYIVNRNICKKKCKHLNKTID